MSEKDPKAPEAPKPVQAVAKLTRVKLIRPARIKLPGTKEEQIYAIGQTVEVTEEQAKELCDDEPTGRKMLAFSGERFMADGQLQYVKQVRGQRVA